MINKKNLLIKNFIRELSTQIPKDYPKKSQILKSIKKDLQSCLQAAPSDSWNTILTDFGTPAEITKSLLTECPETDIYNILHKKRNLKKLLFALCILLSGFTICFLGYMYYQENYQNNYINEAQYIFKDGTSVPLKDIQDK